MKEGIEALGFKKLSIICPLEGEVAHAVRDDVYNTPLLIRPVQDIVQ